ncbi:hypothetical protein H0H81_001241, partial [Sphagnurus paluster]
LIYGFFAANAGVQFISNMLSMTMSSRETRRIMLAAEDIFKQTYPPPESDLVDEIIVDPMHDIVLGDYLHYRDGPDTRVVLIKDRGWSAMKGDYYIVTPHLDPELDDNALDEQVPKDVMAEWFANRI